MDPKVVRKLLLFSEDIITTYYWKNTFNNIGEKHFMSLPIVFIIIS